MRERKISKEGRKCKDLRKKERKKERKIYKPERDYLFIYFLL